MSDPVVHGSEEESMEEYSDSHHEEDPIAPPVAAPNQYDTIFKEAEDATKKDIDRKRKLIRLITALQQNHPDLKEGSFTAKYEKYLNKSIDELQAMYDSLRDQLGNTHAFQNASMITSAIAPFGEIALGAPGLADQISKDMELHYHLEILMEDWLPLGLGKYAHLIQSVMGIVNNVQSCVRANKRQKTGDAPGEEKKVYNNESDSSVHTTTQHETPSSEVQHETPL
jgi:hypothetical protein